MCGRHRAAANGEGEALRGSDLAREGVGSAPGLPGRRGGDKQVQVERPFGSRRAQLRRLTVGGFLKPFETGSLRTLFVSFRGAQFKGARRGATQSLQHPAEQARRAAGQSPWDQCPPAVAMVGGCGLPALGRPGPRRARRQEASSCPPRSPFTLDPWRSWEARRESEEMKLGAGPRGADPVTFPTQENAALPNLPNPPNDKQEPGKRPTPAMSALLG